jgi:hypothetical protein
MDVTGHEGILQVLSPLGSSEPRLVRSVPFGHEKGPRGKA